MEIWKPIKGFETKYKVSNAGRVSGVDRTRVGKSGGVYPVKGKVLSSGVKYRTYPQVVLYDQGVKTNRLVHRLVAEAFIPNPKNKPCVNHKNGIKTDNRVENLEWCNRSENQIHAYKTGLQKHQHGEDRYCSKLTRDEVVDIKKRLKRGEKTVSISKMFNVNSVTITDIKMKRTWVRV